MSELHVAGVQQAAARLRHLSATMQTEYEAAIADAAKPIIEAARRNAASTLPRRGGLAALVAGSTFSVQRLRTGRGGGVRIRTADHDKRLDTQGRLRHPTYGHRPWVSQQVKPGWFSAAARRAEFAVRERMEQASRRIAGKIGGKAA